jgi:Domain of unknown function (DUF4160)
VAVRGSLAEFEFLTASGLGRYGAFVVKVVQRGRIRVYVYDERGHRHHRPHCHVYWPGGACVIDLEQGKLLVGPLPPAAAWELFRDHIEELQRAWDLLNQERTSR